MQLLGSPLCLSMCVSLSVYVSLCLCMYVCMCLVFLSHIFMYVQVYMCMGADTLVCLYMGEFMGVTSQLPPTFSFVDRVSHWPRTHSVG